MCGWFSDASSCASRPKRPRRSGSAANRSRSTLMATSRFSFVSRAQYTSPIPPEPSADLISYAPRREPEVRGMTRFGSYATLSNRLRASDFRLQTCTVRSMRSDPVAVIDIGSNSGRVMAFQRDASSHLRLLAGSRAPLRLVHVVDTRQRLSEETMARTMEALRDFQAIATSAGATRIVAVAT